MKNRTLEEGMKISHEESFMMMGVLILVEVTDWSGSSQFAVIALRNCRDNFIRLSRLISLRMKEISSTTFSFRQRVGAIDFHSLTSVSLRKVIESNDIGELQTLLDTVTFSDFNENDCREQSIGAVTKLVNVR